MGNRRIAANTLFTVGQSLVSIVCALFTSRWVLNALGHDGYGVFAVVGSVMVFVLFLNSVLVSSASRHLAFAIGEASGMSHEMGISYIGQWFAASQYVHLILPLFLCGIGYFVGEWYIGHYLSVSDELRGACFWVFRFSLITAFFTIVLAPYTALYSARQLIFVRTIFSLFQTVLLSCAAYFLFFIREDRLFWHACMVMIVNVSVAFVICGFALVKFPETRLLFAGTRLKYVKDLFAFGGAQMLGMFANMLRAQGMAIAVNRYSGVKMNAGMGIGNQISGKASILSTAAMGAILPEITTCLASDRRERAIKMADRCNLYIPATYAFIIFPVLANIDYILKVWLGNPPECVTYFCGISLFMLYFDALTGGAQMLINANGRIVAYHACAGSVVASSILVAIAMYLFGFNAVWAVGVGVLAPTALLSPIRLVFVNAFFRISPKKWIVRNFLPNMLLIAVALITSSLATWIWGSGFFQFTGTLIVNLFMVSIALVLVMPQEDRKFLFNKLRQKALRLRSNSIG